MKMFLGIILMVIGISVACAGYKSTSSPSAASNASPLAQVANPPTNGTNQDKPTCGLNMSQAPVLHGLKLGMTPDEVTALFPGSKDDAEVRMDLAKPPSRFGVSSFLIRPSKFESKEQFAGIRQISFTMLDGRVSNLNIGYNGPDHGHVDKFVTNFIQGTTLPAVDQWEAYVGMDNQLKTLTCTNFEVRVFAGGTGGNLNYVQMKDLEADKKVKERRAKATAAATPEKR